MNDIRELPYEMDAIQYVKLEALARERGLTPEELAGIFLDTWVGLTLGVTDARTKERVA